MVLGRLGEPGGTLTRYIGDARTPRHYSVVNVEIDRVFAWNTTEAADPTRLTMLVAFFSPIVDLGPMEAPFPEGVQVLLILGDGTADGFLVEDEGFADLPPGQLFYPIPTGAWFRLENGDFTGLQPKHEHHWGPIRDFEHLVTLVDEGAAAIARGELPDPTSTPEPFIRDCEPRDFEESTQKVDSRFTHDGAALCIWWEPQAGATRYRVEFLFTAGGIDGGYYADGAQRSVEFILDRIDVPEGQDRRVVLSDVVVSVWATVDGDEALVDSVALQRQ